MTVRREARARWLAAATVLAVVGSAALLAWVRNADAPPAVVDDPALVVFERLDCGMCHSLHGQGDPRRPLDRVGERLDAPSIRAWTVGEGPARAALPTSTLRIKARFAAEPDIDLLVDYLTRQRGPAR